MRLTAWYAAAAVLSTAVWLAGVGPAPADTAKDPAPAAPVTGPVPAKLPAVDPLAHKGYVEAVPGSDVKFEMVAVPGGTFLIGSPAGEAGRKDEEGPQRPVTVKPFWMGKCEVTWEEFDLYRKEKGADNPESNDEILEKDADAVTGPTPPYVDPLYGHGKEGHPALCMTQHAAMEYCRWLSAKTGKTYRLPTEAEWEWACRAGTTTAYSFGDDPKDLAGYGWFAKNSPKDGRTGTTHPVGTLKPNAWGLHDMHGNVLEWCVDQYAKDLYESFPADKAVVGPVRVPGENRFPHVARGGSWADEPAACRSAARRGSDRTWIKHDPQRPRSIWWLTKMDVIGFRIVRSLDEADPVNKIRSKVNRDSPLGR